MSKILSVALSHSHLCWLGCTCGGQQSWLSVDKTEATCLQKNARKSKLLKTCSFLVFFSRTTSLPHRLVWARANFYCNVCDSIFYADNFYFRLYDFIYSGNLSPTEPFRRAAEKGANHGDGNSLWSILVADWSDKNAEVSLGAALNRGCKFIANFIGTFHEIGSAKQCRSRNLNLFLSNREMV